MSWDILALLFYTFLGNVIFKVVGFWIPTTEQVLMNFGRIKSNEKYTENILKSCAKKNLVSSLFLLSAGLKIIHA